MTNYSTRGSSTCPRNAIRTARTCIPISCFAFSFFFLTQRRELGGINERGERDEVCAWVILDEGVAQSSRYLATRSISKLRGSAGNKVWSRSTLSFLDTLQPFEIRNPRCEFYIRRRVNENGDSSIKRPDVNSEPDPRFQPPVRRTSIRNLKLSLVREMTSIGHSRTDNEVVPLKQGRGSTVCTRARTA